MVQIQSYDQMRAIAQTMVKGNLLGCKNVDQALGLMLIAQAEGKHPATVSKEYHIINGKPALTAEACLARFQAAGGSIQWTEKSDDNCAAVFTHPKGGEVEIRWTAERAKKAQLKSPVWSRFPQQMLSARVVGEGVRACFPGCIEGFYTREEQEDIPDTPANDLLDALQDADKRVIEGEVVSAIDEEIEFAQSLDELRAAAEKIKKMSNEEQDRLRPIYKTRYANLNKMEKVNDQ
ncbi:MAG: hypothetical protein GY922_02260 [Proteobacteria bacterium]|nr:hypothetical protein [Pseudomonadota bacterium]